MAERRLVDIDQAQTYTAPNGAQYRLRPNSSGLLLNGGTEDNPASTEAPATDAVAMWKASEYDGSSQFLKDQSGNGHHLRFGSQFPAYIAKGALNLPGVTGNYASTPDSAAVSITGDIDIRVHAAANDWTPSANQNLAAKWSSSNSWLLQLATSGALYFAWNENDGDFRDATSSPLGIADGSNRWLRVTLDVDNGSGNRVITFYTSTDGQSWSVHGSAISTAGTTSIFDGTESLAIGASSTGGSVFNGRIFYAEVRNGIDGPVAAKFDPSEVDDFTTSFQSITGETWTVQTPGAVIRSGKLLLPGVAGSSYASVPHTDNLNVVGDSEWEWHGSVDSLTEVDERYVMSKYFSTGNQRMLLFGFTSSGGLRVWASNDGTSGNTLGVTSSVTLGSVGITAGQDIGLKMTRRKSDGRIQFFYSTDDGENWTQLGSDQTLYSGTDFFASTAQVEIGGQGFGQSPKAGTCRRAIIRDGIDGDEVLHIDFADSSLGSYLTAFTCDTGQTVTLRGQTGSDSNDPKYLQYEAEKYLYLPGANGNYASHPRHPALSITGDIDIRVKVALDDWTPGAGQTIIAKNGASGQRSWRLFLNTDGTLWFRATTDGTTYFAGVSSVGTGIADGAVKWVRVTRAAASGDVKFYLSDNGLSWVQLGSTSSAASGAIFDSTAPVEIGSIVDGTETMAGKFYRAVIKDGINGTTVYDVDFTEAEPDSTTIDNGIFPILANRTTFTRATTAYLDGVEVASGTPRYTSGKNLLASADDSSFENSIPSGWITTLGGRSSATRELGGLFGNYCLRYGSSNNGDSAGPVTPYINVVQGMVYTFSYHVKQNSGTPVNLGTSGITIVAPTWSYVGSNLVALTLGSVSRTNVGNGWWRISAPLTATATGVAKFAPTGLPNSNSTTWDFDGMQLELGATATEWRVGGPSAVLIEEGTTNLLPAAGSLADDTSSGYWARVTGAGSNFSITTDTSKLISGFPLASSIKLTTTSATGHGFRMGHNATSDIPLANGTQQYTHSFWVYADTAISCNLVMQFTESDGSNFVEGRLAFTTAAGSWKRIIGTYAPAAGRTRIAAYISMPGNSTIYVTAPQLEQKGFATSWHIGGGTRQSDHAIIPAGSGLIDFTEGSMEAIFTPGAGWATGETGSGDGYYRVIGHSTAINKNEIQIVRQSGQSAVSLSVWDNAGVSNGGAIIGTTAVTVGTPVYVCATWDAANLKFYVDGALKITQPITNRPTVHGVLGIGTHPDTNRYLNGELDMIRVSRVARTQAEVTAAATAMKFESDGDTTLFQDYRSTLEGKYSAITTINRSASGRKSVVVDRDLFLLGTDDYLEAPHHSDMDFGVGDSFTAVIAMRTQGVHTGGAHFLMSKKENGASIGQGWALIAFESSGVTRLTLHHGDGSFGSPTPSLTPSEFIRELSIITGRRDVDSDERSIFLNETEGSSGDSTTGSSANNLPLRIGRGGGALTNYADFEFIGAAIWRRALTDEEIEYLAGEFSV